ncbi:MAG: hypothetical protein WC449_05935 [Candidatus Paceibacterota bacterium]
MIGDKDQQKRRMMLNHAMMNSGYKFIKLRLIDMRKNGIQGAYYLHGTPFNNHESGMIDYQFEVKGGPLVFEQDEFTGGWYTNMLDIEHNRRFLASMSAFKCWIIEDKQVEKEILEIAETMTKKAIRKVVERPKEAQMSDDELRRKKLELEHEITRRELAKEPVVTKEPVEPNEAKQEPTIVQGAELQETDDSGDVIISDGVEDVCVETPDDQSGSANDLPDEGPGTPTADDNFLPEKPPAKRPAKRRKPQRSKLVTVEE